MQVRYTFGNMLVSQTRSPSTSPATSFYGYDAHGSISFLTDSAGNVTDNYDYDAFGNPISRIGLTPNTRLYVGEEFDPDLGLITLRADTTTRAWAGFSPLTRSTSRLPEKL